MTTKKLLILGGYGSTGRCLADLLLQESDVELVLAGRNQGKAQALAAKLNDKYGGERVYHLRLDASDPQSLHHSYDGIDMVVVASSTAEFTEQVAGAALEAGIDYFDVLYSTRKFDALDAMASNIKVAGRCFVTDGGFHPGLPAALIRYLAPRFDKLESARVGSVIKFDWNTLDLSPSTMEEFVAEFIDFQTLEFKEGHWVKSGALSMMLPKYIDFSCDIGPDFGRQYAIPMFLEEMRAIPELYPGITDTSFLVGGFNWFVDWFVSPIIMVALKLWPQRALPSMGRLMFWGLRKFGKPPFGTLLKAEARGLKDGKPASIDLFLYHDDGYMFTAVPAAACLLQLLDGSERKPGLWLQAHIVDPERMMIDMERMEIQSQLRSS